jgi:hypothetical protein
VNVRPKSRTPIVSRQYRNAPDHCAQALELLLKKLLIEGGPANRPDAGKEINEQSGKAIIPS